MSLAARCPSCATVFRVVQDQLRVSDGWVRCGRCSEVFNAIETLVDLDADSNFAPPSSPGALAAPSPGQARVMEELARVAAASQGSAWPPASASADVTAPAVAGRAAPPPEPAPPPPPALRDLSADRHDDRGDDRDDSPPPDLRAEPDARIGLPDRSDRIERIERTPPTEQPTFVRQAERAARWRQPKVRLALAAVGVLAAAGLVAQATLEYRDLVAARWPALRPALEQACAAAGCVVQAPRAIEALQVESSGLVRVDGTSIYRLAVVLRNRAPWALAVPSLDLTLTDNQGRVIARRVVTLADLGSAATTVPPGTELPLQATLGTAERAVSGYTIDLFYP